MKLLARSAPAVLFMSIPLGGQAVDRPVHMFDEMAVAPDGTSIATVEHDEPAIDGIEPTDALVIRPTSGGAAAIVPLPCGSRPDCKPSEIAFSADSKRLGFVLKRPYDSRSCIYEVRADGSDLVQKLAFDGTLKRLRYAPNGTLAVLATAGAQKQAGATTPAAVLAGEVGASADEQRIALLGRTGLHFVSPSKLYVYEYDWRPDGSGFVATASAGNGDDHWWVARLWSFPTSGPARVIYTPPPKQQIASPLVSPDGSRVAFIGGIMSDFGSTGGDAFTLSLSGGSKPIDLTPGIPATVTALDWR